ncbi:Uncharacterized protein GQ600_12012 [Phytophthora cactorum]|nr:Uncharacterized protein GQ600_12012 [Phytophthora cactorum]
MPVSITVDNLQEDEVLSYPLVLLEGRITDLHPTDNLFLDARVRAAPVAWQIRHHSATHWHCHRIFCIEYQPRLTRFVVKFHYQICSDADDRDGFDAPLGVDNSDAVAIAKIRFNALLLQMANGRVDARGGLAPTDVRYAVRTGRTARRDAAALQIRQRPRAICGRSEAHKIGSTRHRSRGLDDHPELEFKHAVVLGCSRYNKDTRKAEGHTALGGGKVGVFGSCGLHTWPSHLGELALCCLNNTRIDTRYLLDDSCYRGTFWANFSTGIGAMLHEIGHTFGSGTPRAASWLSFRRSTAQGWIDLNHSAVREVTSRGGAHWNSASAQLLRHCPWISGYAKPSLVGPTVDWGSSVLGLVGHGTYNGTQIELPEKKLSSSVDDQLGAVMLDAGKYIDHLET